MPSNSKGRFEGRVALVTGASRGIGAATAQLLAEGGAKVVLVSRTAERLAKVAGEINARHGAARALAIAGDIADERFVRGAFEQAEKQLGPVTILVNNAGLFTLSGLAEMALADWERVFATNVTGMFLCCKYAVAQMRKSGGGSIVNISSLAGIRSSLKFKGFTSYIASKHAVVGLTEGLAHDERENGIRVNCVAPGAVDTEMLRKALPDFKAKAQPLDIAKVIAYLCDSEASGAVTGAALEVNTNG